MFLLIIGLWLLCLLYFNPRLIALLIGPEPLIAKAFLLIFIIELDFFCLYVFFHLVIVAFSYFAKKSCFSGVSFADNFCATGKLFPPVAFLYTTCNDFQEPAALSHLNQDYSNSHFFILDDSTDISLQKKIDEFSARFPLALTVIRRKNKNGFKAGNINYALRLLDAKFKYFSVSDSDTVIPRDYISSLLPYLTNPRIAFVQSAQATNISQQTQFARFMGPNTDIHFRHYASTKNRYGFVMWYGHGALLRRDVCERIGGIPEIATEDLAYSMKVREQGFEGIFVEKVCCYEDFPPTYKQYRKRNEK